MTLLFSIVITTFGEIVYEMIKLSYIITNNYLDQTLKLHQHCGSILSFSWIIIAFIIFEVYEQT